MYIRAYAVIVPSRIVSVQLASIFVYSEHYQRFTAVGAQTKGIRYMKILKSFFKDR